MAILTGLTRVPDPINSEQLSAHVTSAIGKTALVEITPSEVIAWGSSVTESDRTAINAAISSYQFEPPSTILPTHSHDYATTGHGHNYADPDHSHPAGGHTHVQDDVTNLTSDLAGKAASVHDHDASYATTGHTHAAPAPTYALLANGATAMGLATTNTVKVTPTANATYTTTVPVAGTDCRIIVLTSGTTSRTITFGTGFKPVGTLATGTVSARVFVISFISDGTNLYEAGRTAAMVA